jgi:hypothetical protein
MSSDSNISNNQCTISVKMNDIYKKHLTYFISHRWLAFPATATAIIMIYILLSVIPTELAPLEDRSRLSINATAPEGATFEYMDRYIDETVDLLNEKVPEKEVLEIIKKTPKVQLQVLDDTEMVNTCPVFVQSEKVMARCRNPCIIGTGKCLEHQKTPIKNVDETKFIKLTRIKVLDTTISEPEPLWCNEEDKLIYNSMGQKVGILNEDNNIEYFVIKE